MSPLPGHPSYMLELQCPLYGDIRVQRLSETEKFQLLRQAMPVYLHSFFNVNPTLKNIEWILSNLDDRYVSPDDSINEIFRDFKKIKPAFVNNDLRRLADELMVWFRRASDAEADSSRVEQEFLDNFFSLLPNATAMLTKIFGHNYSLRRSSPKAKRFDENQWSLPPKSGENIQTENLLYWPGFIDVRPIVLNSDDIQWSSPSPLASSQFIQRRKDTCHSPQQHYYDYDRR
ncbi:hypothetical protein HUG17_9594 [Dermatophagoides farinae]|uniref:Uncharacterized protein n=1 Tax=Dermatophagoides farinae TaxID=6954 RepID=A0A9D4P2P1_DERFA|nr:hypothetical protein HUG17_9594 [Dermatophagoides farinae]